MARLVALIGPTASGKSAVALAAARQLRTVHAIPVELVSIDAFQVYRGMDIGTAKPSVAERAEIPHYLIDLIGPDEHFTVADFQRRFEQVRDDLTARTTAGILVGGTGLYHRVVVDGLTLPGEWPELREELESEAETCGAASLHERLERLDPVAASRMEPSNARRVVRALEVCIGSGRPFSSFGPGLQSYPPTPVVQIGLRWTREALGVRIQQRTRAMLDAGFLDEVRSLLEGPEWSRTAAQALGYGEIADVVAGRCTLDEATDRIEMRTRQLAVRQERWFRRDPRIHWVDISADPVTEALPAVIEVLSG